MPVETRLAQRLVLEPYRGDRQHREPVGADQEGVLVGAVRRAAVLDDAQAPGGDLVDDPVVEQDHAIGDVLLETVAGERVLAALAGDDRGDAAVLQPAEQAPQLGPEDGVVGEAGEERLDGVEHDPLGADRVDGMAEADEQALEVVLAGLLDLAALDVDEVERDLLLPHQLVEVEAERAHVRGQLGRALLEGHEHARLVHRRRAADDELGREHGLAAARAAADQRRPAARQAAAGDVVETRDSGPGLGQIEPGGGILFLHGSGGAVEGGATMPSPRGAAAASLGRRRACPSGTPGQSRRSGKPGRIGS